MIPTKENPEFCVIAPTPYLPKFASQSNAHLVLAHLVDTDPVYAEFYRNRTEFKIMDNGAFELGESYPPDKLMSIGEQCGADVLVLPDYPFCDSYKTKEAAERMIPIFKNGGFKTMFVPQSERGNLEDWIESYMWASLNKDIDLIGISILGAPNALPHIPKSYARVVMTQLLMDRELFNFDKYHHYLGSNAGMALEVPPLIEMGAMNSCDSSNPVWMGILGHEYVKNTDSYLPVKKVSMPVQFDYPLTKDVETLRIVQHNIDLTQELFNNN